MQQEEQFKRVVRQSRPADSIRDQRLRALASSIVGSADPYDTVINSWQGIQDVQIRRFLAEQMLRHFPTRYALALHLARDMAAPDAMAYLTDADRFPDPESRGELLVRGRHPGSAGSDAVHPRHPGLVLPDHGNAS